MEISFLTTKRGVKLKKYAHSKEAIESSGWTKEGFLAALRHYFVFIKKNTVNFLDHVSCLLFHTSHTKFYDFDVKTIFADHNIVVSFRALLYFFFISRDVTCNHRHARRFSSLGLRVLIFTGEALN